jgi:hypothetical protein
MNQNGQGQPTKVSITAATKILELQQAAMMSLDMYGS